MEEAICGPWLTPLPTKRWSSLRENLCYLGKLYIGHQTTQKPRKYMALFLVLIQKLYMSFWIRDLKSLALIFPLPCLVFQQKWHWFSQFLEQESLKLKKKKSPLYCLRKWILYWIWNIQVTVMSSTRRREQNISLKIRLRVQVYRLVKSVR